MRYLDLIGIPDVFGNNSEAMILRGNLAMIFDDILHGMIQPAMSVEHFMRTYIVGKRKKLMPQTYPE
jgi:hypothetical protein